MDYEAYLSMHDRNVSQTGKVNIFLANQLQLCAARLAVTFFLC